MPNGLSYRLRKKEEVVARYGGHCVCCGETNPLFLTLDHIDGRGADHRRELEPGKQSRPSGGVNFYNYLLRLEGRHPNIQLMCWNCNCTKHHYGICPHEQALTDTLSRGMIYLDDRNSPLTPCGEMVNTAV